MSEYADRVPPVVSGAGVSTFTLAGRLFADRDGAIPLELNDDGSYTAPEGGQLVWADLRP